MKKISLTALLVAMASVSARAGGWTVMAGNSSGVTSFQKVEIRDQRSWESLWRRHNGPTGAPPAVDFSRGMVVGVFLGQRPSTGYSVDLEVKFVHHKAYELSLTEVTYRENAPAAGTFVMPAMSQPFALRTVRVTSGVVFHDGRPKDSPAAGQRADAGGLEALRDAVAIAEAGDARSSSPELMKVSPGLELKGVWNRVRQLASSVQDSFGGTRAADGLLGSQSGDPSIVLVKGLPPPPGEDDRTSSSAGRRRGKSLPPPPGESGYESGKRLPPPPGEGDSGKRLPPPPGEGDSGKRLPPPPGDDNQGKPLPPPPNYRSRPSSPPSQWPTSPSRVDRYSRSVDAGYVASPYTYTDSWQYGAWSWDSDSQGFSRGGSETGLGMNAHYVKTVHSTEKRTRTRQVWRRYWRYVGHNCQEWNGVDHCEDWRLQDAADFLDEIERVTETGSTRSLQVVVDFSGDKPLLPWEREGFSVNYDGSGVSISQDGAYHYSVRGPIIDQQAGTAKVVLSAGQKRLQAPEREKVGLSLANEGGKLVLAVSDARARHYAGERLEVAATVYREEKPSLRNWLGRDVVVYKTAQNGAPGVVVDAKAPRQVLDKVPTEGSGKRYYIESWSFRRANSKISRPDWIDRGKGGELRY